jgi:ABC-type Zn uptake system ZnuABC Zn-binding protein ZnuA
LRTVIIVLAVVAAITTAVACVAEPSPAIPPEATAVETLKVVTTVSPITSIVENIGGTRITLQGIVPEGVNSHTFEPAPSVAAILADADLVFLNGLFLEEPTLELARANQKPGSMIVSLGDQITSKDEWQFDFSFPEENGQPNPHLWPDPILALKYAEVVRDTMSERDPDNANYYSENYDKFAGRIADLDAAIVAIIATVPSGNRKLLTYHDSWAYFARRYGMTVIGAMRPSNFSEPSAREVADLIQQIESEGIPAVFGSEVFDSDVMETIAAESGAAYVDELSDDDLPGAPGDPRHSYLGLVVNNLEIMVPALGGDASALENIDVSPVFDGPSAAVYPQ